MVRLSRYILVFMAILAFAIVLPRLYWTAFDKPIPKPFILYSTLNGNFMVQQSTDSGVKRYDSKGNEYKTREEFEQQLPLMYTQQLMVSGTMPDSINGVETDMRTFSMARSTFRFKPEDLHGPKPALFPMFESQSGRANLEMPEDMFRVNWRMDFIDTKTNKINEEKSRLFSGVLHQSGFKFPARLIAGLPTTRKSIDEGYFMTDASGELFHIKMVKGEPYVRMIKKPAELKFKHINAVDFKDKKYYAYLFSNNNEIYVLSQDDYRLYKWPATKFNADSTTLKIYGDLFNYNVIVEGENFVEATALDPEYNKVAAYRNEWTPRGEKQMGKVHDVIFPWTLSITNPLTKYANFYFQKSGGFLWIIGSVLLAGVQAYLLKRKNLPIKNHIVDLMLILLTGIFGFLAVNIFPNKFFK